MALTPAPLRLLALPAAVAVLALAGCGPSPALIRLPAKRLVLSLSQLPYPGFVVDHDVTAGSYSDRRAAAGDRTVLKEMESEGRTGGFEADFDRLTSPQQAVGPTVVESNAVTYRSDFGAQRGLELIERETRASGAQEISSGKLGQSTAAFSIVRTADQTTYEAFLVEWRQANVVNGVEIEGNEATLDLGYALTIARVQQKAEVKLS